MEVEKKIMLFILRVSESKNEERWETFEKKNNGFFSRIKCGCEFGLIGPFCQAEQNGSHSLNMFQWNHWMARLKKSKYQRETWLLKGPIAIARTADCSRVTMDARWWWSSAAGVPRRNDRMQHCHPSWAFFQSRWMLWFPFCCYDKYWNETRHWVGKDLFDLHSQDTVHNWGGQGRNSGRSLRKKLCWECCFLA